MISSPVWKGWFLLTPVCGQLTFPNRRVCITGCLGNGGEGTLLDGRGLNHSKRLRDSLFVVRVRDCRGVLLSLIDFYPVVVGTGGSHGKAPRGATTRALGSRLRRVMADAVMTAAIEKRWLPWSVISLRYLQISKRSAGASPEQNVQNQSSPTSLQPRGISKITKT